MTSSIVVSQYLDGYGNGEITDIAIMNVEGSSLRMQKDNVAILFYKYKGDNFDREMVVYHVTQIKIIQAGEIL